MLTKRNQQDFDERLEDTAEGKKRKGYEDKNLAGEARS